MHYGPYAFSRNGQRTIQPRVSQLLYLFLVLTCRFLARFMVSFREIRLIITENNKERQVVRQQYVGEEVWVHSQASLSGDYGA